MRIVRLNKAYGEKPVLKDLSLDIEEGKILCVLGPSGGGKTTLLNILAGLTDYSGELIGVPERVGYVFQEPRLIPFLTVEENLKYAGAEEPKITEMLERVELEAHRKKRSFELSGGEKSRVSLARALLADAELLLFDEPFSSLDKPLKRRLLEMCKDLLKGAKKTVIYVTHDEDEAAFMADKTVRLSEGRIC